MVPRPHTFNCGKNFILEFSDASQQRGRNEMKNIHHPTTTIQRRSNIQNIQHPTFREDPDPTSEGQARRPAKYWILVFERFSVGWMLVVWSFSYPFIHEAARK